MKYASECGGMISSVHDWKPCPPDRFAKLLHRYTTECGDEFGHSGLTTTAVRLDRTSTATIYYMPKSGKQPDPVSSPVLMTVAMSDGKIVSFESLKYGLDISDDEKRTMPIDRVENQTSFTGTLTTVQGSLTKQNYGSNSASSISSEATTSAGNAATSAANAATSASNAANAAAAAASSASCAASMANTASSSAQEAKLILSECREIFDKIRHLTR